MSARVFCLSSAARAVSVRPPQGLNERYGLAMRRESVPDLLERFGLRTGEPLSGGWTAQRR